MYTSSVQHYIWANQSVCTSNDNIQVYTTDGQAYFFLELEPELLSSNHFIGAGAGALWLHFILAMAHSLELLGSRFFLVPETELWSQMSL